MGHGSNETDGVFRKDSNRRFLRDVWIERHLVKKGSDEMIVILHVNRYLTGDLMKGSSSCFQSQPLAKVILKKEKARRDQGDNDYKVSQDVGADCD